MDPIGAGVSVIPKNSWQHVAVTYTRSDSSLRFYINGSFNGSATSVPSPNSATNTGLRIGQDTWNQNTYGFNGRIDDIRVYNRALDSCSIKGLYKTLCNSLNILPVTFISFTGFANSNSIVLNWKTAEETNSDYFIIERSTDGIAYKSIKQMSTSNSGRIVKSYDLIDQAPEPGRNYYRIKTVDKDGSFNYSKVLSINFGGNQLKALIYPTKVKNDLHIRFEGIPQQKTELLIVDMQGRTIKSYTVQLLQGNMSSDLNVSNLANGVYRVILNGQKLDLGVFIKE